MFCNTCGNAILAGQTTCSRCGASVAATTPMGATAPVVASQGRVARHLRLLAILWFVLAVLSGLVPTIVMLVASGFVGTILQEHGGGEPIATAIAPIAVMVMALLFAAFTLVMFLTGWGLYKVRPWGRTLAIVMGILAVFHPPLGTALGIYTLIVLLSSNAGDEYRAMAAGAEAAQGSVAA